jgi:hypothetical protein
LSVQAHIPTVPPVAPPPMLSTQPAVAPVEVLPKLKISTPQHYQRITTS